MGCKTTQVFVNMSEEQFKKEHASAKVVELSQYRTVYKQTQYSVTNAVEKFYYFKNGKLVLMDEGFVPHGMQAPVPTPGR